MNMHNNTEVHKDSTWSVWNRYRSMFLSSNLLNNPNLWILFLKAATLETGRLHQQKGHTNLLHCVMCAPVVETTPKQPEARVISDSMCRKQPLRRLNQLGSPWGDVTGSGLNSRLCQTSGRNTKCSLETQWRWRDLSRFTHLIVRPEWRSSPRRQVWLTSELKPGFKSQTTGIKNREKPAEKHASTPANGVATSGI